MPKRYMKKPKDFNYPQIIYRFGAISIKLPPMLFVDIQTNSQIHIERNKAQNNIKK